MSRGHPNRVLRIVRERSAAVSVRVRDAVTAALAGGSDLAGAALAAHRATDGEAERVLARPGARSPACARGCAFCCHVDVEATRAELDAVVSYLRATRTTAELDTLAALLPRASSLTSEERWTARVPCAFLAGDRSCSIHPVRPLRCRAFHSCDAMRCESAFLGESDEEPVTNDLLARAYDAAEAGLGAALEDGGVSAAPELLEAGVLRRLSAG